MIQNQIVVIGGGGAGLSVALQLAPLPVTILIAEPPNDGSATAWAQGGIAAAIGHNDHPNQHCKDTIKAGDGLVDAQVAKRVTHIAPDCINFLRNIGVPFDCDKEGVLAVGREAAHSQARILHVAGDQTGKAIHKALIKAAQNAPHIKLLTGVRAIDLVTSGNRVCGVMAVHDRAIQVLPARGVVLATGGVGGLYEDTTNPLSSLGQGIAMAARAGAKLRDLEFVQFHPTAIDIGLSPMPLATEALRGAGAVLTDETNARFMMNIPDYELAPRDVVSRAVWQCIMQGKKVYLDGRKAIGSDFARRFPTIFAHCLKAKIDPRVMPIPIRPAAHYHMGGVETNQRGRTSLEDLWACGEVAATGLHGANRLAGNSLLEVIAFSIWTAQDILNKEPYNGRYEIIPPSDDSPVDNSLDSQAIASIRTVMSHCVGIIRDKDGLYIGLGKLQHILDMATAGSKIHDAATAALMITVAALNRKESRGGHFRHDFPFRTHAGAVPIWTDLETAMVVSRKTHIFSVA